MLSSSEKQGPRSLTVLEKTVRGAACAALATLVLCCSCQRQSDTRNLSAQPVSVNGAFYALEISPGSAVRNSTVSLTLTGFAANEAKIEWLLNGSPAESDSSNQFTLSRAIKGDMLQARTLIQGREVLSNKVQVVNAPPEISSIQLQADSARPESALEVAVTGSDADNDTVTFLYEWTVNGTPAGTQQRIGKPLKRGDAVAVKVTPYDGESYGRSVSLNREIENLPPIIQQRNDFQFDGTRYTYQVRASDPDGDPLAYALESRVEGMSIDRSSGLITWNVPAQFKGSKNVTVVVTDGHGGTATSVLNMTIR